MKIDKKIEIYIKALENEYFIDLEQAQKKNLKYNIFRPNKYTGKINYILKYFLFCLLIPVCPFFSRLTLPVANKNELFFVCSKKSEEIFRNKQSSCYFGYLSRGVTLTFSLSNFFLYLKIVLAFIKKFKYNFWFYPELVLVPEMILIDNYLSSVDGGVINITNQYDRWAYFISTLSEKNTVNLFQHGILSSAFTPENKINKIDTLNCYNDEQKCLFLSNIITKVNDINLSSPFLRLFPDLGKYSVLFCSTCDLSYLGIEKKLINNLIKNKSINFVIRPHPLRRNNSYGDIPIYEGNIFPKVCILIHFNSTLGLEYENSDPNVITIDASKFTYLDVLSRVKDIFM